MELLEINNYTKIISYIITVVIGGVGYKYLALLLTSKKDAAASNRDSSQMVIDAMMLQIKSLTERIDNLERERENYHIREVEVTKQLAKAESEVFYLKMELGKLKKNQATMTTKLNNETIKNGDSE
jgi:chromosome segregation ATPase